jgi:hypothetical protein
VPGNGDGHIVIEVLGCIEALPPTDGAATALLGCRARNEVSCLSRMSANNLDALQINEFCALQTGVRFSTLPYYSRAFKLAGLSSSSLALLLSRAAWMP